MNHIIKGKLSKKKREPVEFGTDNIDTTAPVKQILDYLQHKNNQAFTYYCQTLRPRCTVKVQNYNFHFTQPGHPIQAFPDDWDGDLNSGYFEPFSYKSLQPKIISPVRNTGKSDPVTDYMETKNAWKSTSRILRQSIVTSSMPEQYASVNEEVVQCPKHYVDVAAHLDCDPDPFFDDSYNWYYSGNGSLQLICLDWIDYLLHGDFDILYLTRFSKADLVLNSQPTATFVCDNSSNILEIICSSNNVIALRTKHKIYILKLSTADETIAFERVKSIESELPFTSISFDTHHKNILYITYLDNKLLIVNLDRLTGRTVKLNTKIDTLVNNWNTVISSDRVSYTHVTRKSISIYDKRNNSMVSTWSAVRDVTDFLTCNDITVAKQCEGSSSLYFGTDHHLFLMDLRYQNKSKPSVAQRWTHGMQCVPTYMIICNFEFNKELICLNSQWCEDTCLVPSYITSLTTGNEVPGVSIPFRPPSILTTLNEMKQKMLSFDLYNPIDTRLSMSVTGQVLLGDNENYVILMQNSLGDISSHTIYPEHMDCFIDDDSYKHLHEWSKLYRHEKKDLEVSHIADISEVWKKLKKTPTGFMMSKDEILSIPTKFKEEEIFDTFEKEALDPGLLEVWINHDSETTLEPSSLAINLHYSDDSSE